MKHANLWKYMLLLAFLQAGANVVVHAQTRVDSLKNIFYSSTNDSIKNKAANEIYDYYLAVNKDSLLYYVAQARVRNLEKEKFDFQNKILFYARWYGIVLLALLSLIFYRSNRQKHKAAIKIGEAYQQLKETQQQLIHSEKLASLGELTAGIAHEIQNPLNFVNNFSELNVELIKEIKDAIQKGDLVEVSALASDMQTNMEKINEHGKRADAIVKGMLQHSRSSSGQKEPTDLNALCDEYLRLAYHGLRAKDKSFNAEFKTSLDPSVEEVNLIPQDMGRVLLNLYNNAFYTVYEKSKKQIPGYAPMVSVKTRRTDNIVHIAIKDNGEGIPETIREKIFQPFFTTKPTGEGTGLGLSLSYDMIRAQGGEIKVVSKEGEGTTFIIQLG